MKRIEHPGSRDNNCNARGGANEDGRVHVGPHTRVTASTWALQIVLYDCASALGTTTRSAGHPETYVEEGDKA